MPRFSVVIRLSWITGKQVEPEAMKVVSLMLLSAGLVLLAGCASPNYALKPELLGSQSSFPFGGSEVVKSTGNSAGVAVVADECDFLKSRYLVVILSVTNTSSSTLDIAQSSLDFRCCSPKGEQRLVPFEPEALVAKMSKERASREASRGWGTLFLALASSSHGGTYSGMASDGTSYTRSYSYTDYGQMANTLNAGTAANRLQSQNESQTIRLVDTFLIRKSQVPPGTKGGGIVFFPFCKSESYKLRAKIGEDTHEFLYRLRSY